MCLNVDMTNKDKLKYAFGLYPKAKEDIEVYVFRKIDIINNKIASPCNKMLWKINKTNKALGWRSFLWNKDGLGKGWIHSMQNRKGLIKYMQEIIPQYAIRFDYRNGYKIQIYKAIIPKGTKYYKGYCNTYLFKLGLEGYASTKLKLKELIYEFNNPYELYQNKPIEYMDEKI